MNRIPLILSLIIAFVFLQSLFFKFTNSYETQYIFGTLAQWSGITVIGKFGGYIIGSCELLASILLFSRVKGLGAALALGIISGAIFFHLFTPLGVVMPEFNTEGQIIGDDGGLLFVMACITFLCAATLVYFDYRHPQGTLRLLYTHLFDLHK